ncbi:MAG: roadblock/LC7 domain-containing protein [Akkermansiaceae bacterium]|nr:roadblock/LC7 domain-containing protein [Akkermansiaceae bacterium]
MNAPRASENWNADDLEMTAETSARAEAILREFATDAELDIALVVDAGGGMIAGVATRPDVDVDTVGALVAGAFGAVRALARELGETAIAESVHHGDRDTLYLREIDHRLLLLGVAGVGQPAGIVREKGSAIAMELSALFGPAAAPEPADEESPFEAEDGDDDALFEAAFELDEEDDEDPAHESPEPAPTQQGMVGDPTLLGRKIEAAAGGDPEEAGGPRYVFDIG